MTSTLSTFTEFVMVDTRQSRGAVWLPEALSNQGRRITIKDAYGTFANSTCQIAASNDDLFDDNTSFKFISTNFASLSFIASGSKWYGLSSNVFNQGTNFPTLSASNLTVSSMNYVNINPSTGNFHVAIGYDSASNSGLQYSIDGISWTPSQGAGFTGFGFGVGYNGRLWVAVGEDSTPNNTIKYSVNGINWCNANSGGFRTGGNRVAWNGRYWVAVGTDASQNNTIKYSFDGSNWLNSAGIGFTTGGRDIAWNGNMWVAVGADLNSNNNIKYSYDGINWSNSLGAGFNTNCTGIAWNGRLWVATGTDSLTTNAFKYSADGITWTNSLGSGFSGGGFRIAWNGRMLVAVGGDTTANNRIKYSYDGITWSNSSGNSLTSGRGIAWNGRMWIATGVGSPASNTINYSFDGISWSSSSSGSGFSFFGYDIAFSSNSIPAYAQSNLSILPQNIPLFLTSTNSILAQPSSLIINDTLIIDRQWDRIGINCNIPQYSLDVNGNVNVSTLNIQSTPIQNIIGSTVQGIGTYGYISTLSLQSTVSGLGSNDQSTVVGLGAYGYVSSLNLRSTVQGLGAYGYISSLQLFSTVDGLPKVYPVLAGGGTTNLQAFTVSTGILFASTVNFINVVPSTMNLWVAGYSNTGTPANNIITSRNGFSWSNTNVTGTFTGGARDFAFNGRMWVGVGVDTTANARIKYSYDGFTWSNSVGGDTFQTVSGTPSGYGIAWNGRYWIALGDSFNSATSNNSIKYSFDGITFSNVTSGGFTVRGAKAAWNGFMWVAAGNNLGSNGALKYSYDGLNWVSAVSRFTIANPGGRDVAWNGKMWVAVGSASLSNDCINYSFDGINWNQCFGNNLFNSGNGVAWNGKVWVAVGDHPTNTILYSYDGINWTLGSNYLFNTSGNKVAWNGEFFIAVGGDNFGSQSGTKRLSYDGITWYDTGDFSSWGIFMIGVGYSSNALPSYSQKGLEILSQNIPYSYFSVNQILVQNSSLTFNNTLMIDRTGVIGINCNIPQYTLDVNGSFNASNINLQGTPIQNIFGSTVTGLGNNDRSTIVGLGAFGYISSLQLFSTVSGLPNTYPALTGGGTTNLQALTVSTGTLFASTMSFVNIVPSTMSRLVAVAYGDLANETIRYSDNGTTWLTVNNGFANASRAYGVAFNGNMWVAVGTAATSNERIKYSFDGINWINNSGGDGGFTGTGWGVAWNGRMWIALGSDATANNRIKYSLNGITWSNTTGASFSDSGRRALWNGQMWVAVGVDTTENNTIKYSFNGINWVNSLGTGFSLTGRDVAWNGRMWIAVGEHSTSNQRVNYSFDGINWLPLAGHGFTSSVYAIKWNGRMWVMTGYVSSAPERPKSIKYSFDGFTWNDSLGTGFNFNGHSITWTGSTWYIVGRDSTAGNVVQSSVDGVTWTPYGGSAFVDEVYGVAFSSNTRAAYTQPNLVMEGQNIPLFFTSTNNIYNQPSSMIINDTVIIDRQWDRVGLNTNIPQFSLDVNGPARTMMPISSLCNTTANVGLAGHGIYYYITNSGFNGLTLPTIDPIGGWFVSLRNNTGTTLSVTISGTNSKIPASPFSIAPANTVTLAYDTAPPSGGCNWVYF